MIIDQTRYDAFWRNPERYRLTYELNLVPKALPYGLARGLALHTIVEEALAGKNKEEINAVLRAEAPGVRGPLPEPLPDKAISMAWVLWEEMQRQYPLVGGEIEIIANEAEFKYDIPGSPHSMAGRIDNVGYRNGELWCLELKTANSRASFDRIAEDWRQKAQADFEIIGARHLGHQVAGVLVLTVVETTPPKVWPLEVRRTDHKLELMKLNVHETCEIIEMLRATFTARLPWPHLSLNWPCAKGGACEYENLCGQAVENWSPADLEGFKQREEHLGVIKDVAAQLPMLPPTVAEAVAA